MNVYFEYLGGMCALFYENRLGIKKNVISLFSCFVRIPGTTFREPYHSNQGIPHRDKKWYFAKHPYILNEISRDGSY